MSVVIYNLFFRNFVLLYTDFISFEFSSASSIPLCKFVGEIELM
jgi:hypothetical protein